MNNTPETPSSSNTPPKTDTFTAAKATAVKVAENLRTAATEKMHDLRHSAEERAAQFRDTAEEKVTEIKEYADKAMTSAKNQAKDIASEVEKYAKAKPVQALLSAFGLGVVVGLVLRNR